MSFIPQEEFITGEINLFKKDPSAVYSSYSDLDWSTLYPLIFAPPFLYSEGISQILNMITNGIY
jgi:hypothetical protein